MTAIWRQRSGSTFAQVMACCLTAPSHYLNQCRLIISEVQWHSYQGNFTKMSQPSITKIFLKITCRQFHSNFPGANELIVTNLASRLLSIASDCTLYRAFTAIPLHWNQMSSWSFEIEMYSLFYHRYFKCQFICVQSVWVYQLYWFGILLSSNVVLFAFGNMW